MRAAVTPGFCLLAGWFALACGWEMLGLVLSAALAHEAGHLAVLRLFGAPVTALRVTVCGAALETDRSGLSYPAELAAALAGPAVNLLCGGALSALGYHSAAGAHLILGLYNLLPVRGLDGGRALTLLLSFLAGPAAGEWAARWIGGGAALSLATVLTWLMIRSGGSLWLLPPAAALAAAGVREFLGET